jgi:hypothetical protein
MKKTYSRPVLTVRGCAAEQTRGRVAGNHYDYSGDLRWVFERV